MAERCHLLSPSPGLPTNTCPFVWLRCRDEGSTQCSLLSFICPLHLTSPLINVFSGDYLSLIGEYKKVQKVPHPSPASPKAHSLQNHRKVLKTKLTLVQVY